jgi:hypothetical protein
VKVSTNGVSRGGNGVGPRYVLVGIGLVALGTVGWRWLPVESQSSEAEAQPVFAPAEPGLVAARYPFLARSAAGGGGGSPTTKSLRPGTHARAAERSNFRADPGVVRPRESGCGLERRA